MIRTSATVAIVILLGACIAAPTTDPVGIQDSKGAQSTDIDAAVRKVIAETAVFVEECGKLYPRDKTTLDAAFANWVVLKLPIPNLASALNPTSSDRVELAGLIGPYLSRIPGYEKEIECSGRYEVLISKEPRLLGDSAHLPPNVLDRYHK